jgi:DNA-binding response OmpR family regulator
MPIIVVLAVGLDSTLLRTQNAAWKSAGYIVKAAGSLREAIECFRDGDFDLVLLGPSIPAETRHEFTFLIRALGSNVPVALIARSPDECDPFADATLRNQPWDAMLAGMGELVARRQAGWR